MKTFVEGRDHSKVPYINDFAAQEGRLNLNEMRMQLQTQLDPYSVENLFFDQRGSANGCDEVKLTINLRLISQYNFEQLKERIRGFSDTISKRVESNIEEFQPFVNYDPLMPQVTPVEGYKTAIVDQDPNLSETEQLDLQIAQLESVLQQELNDISQLKGSIKQELTRRMDKSQERSEAVEKQIEVINQVEEWIQDSKSRENKILTTNRKQEFNTMTKEEMLHRNLKIATTQSKSALGDAKAIQSDLLYKINNEL